MKVNMPIDDIRKQYEKYVGLSDYQTFWRDLFYFSLDGLNIGTGTDFEDSGESRAIEIIRDRLKKQNPVVFDVGANVGGYAEKVKASIPAAQIYCFEPAKKTYEKLKNNLYGSDININNIGFSDVRQNTTLYFDVETSGMASLYNRQLDYKGIEFDKCEEVMIDTIDNYCRDNNISCIDFLKCDVEGNELAVLRGAKDMLQKGKISAIQVEVGGCNIDSRVFLRDFFNLLSEDFNMYRIMKDGLYKISRYNEKFELFVCTNYVFINKNVDE